MVTDHEDTRTSQGVHIRRQHEIGGLIARLRFRRFCADVRAALHTGRFDGEITSSARTSPSARAAHSLCDYRGDRTRFPRRNVRSSLTTHLPARRFSRKVTGLFSAGSSERYKFRSQCIGRQTKSPEHYNKLQVNHPRILESQVHSVNEVWKDTRIPLIQ